MKRSAWTGSWTPTRNADLRLFCLPYAGGGAAVFRDWAREMPPTIDVVPIHLPGRESRTSEPPATALSDLLPRLTDGIAPFLDCPFALFGHSMGALVAFELAHALVAAGRAPEQLVVSGRRGPQRPSPEPPCHTLPDDEFIDRVWTYQGTPAEVQQAPEIVSFYLPILRADFTLCETYVRTPKPRLPVPITVYGGEDDQDVSESDLRAWALETSRPCRVRVFRGGHFYLKEDRAALLAALEHDLAAARRVAVR